MYYIPLPDEKREIEVILLFMMQMYSACDKKETRRLIRHRYRAAAEKYNKLAGQDLYCLNINLQKKFRP